MFRTANRQALTGPLRLVWQKKSLLAQTPTSLVNTSGSIRRQSNVFKRYEYESWFSRSEKDEQAFKAIILANLLVFANWRLDWPLPRYLMGKYFTASTYGVFREKNIVSLVGAAFSHIDGYHLFANMLTFGFFGREVFLSMGRKFAIPMYIAAGALGSFAQVYEGKRNRYNSTVIGASGAVSSFVVFSVLQNPRATIIVWFLFPIPAALFGLLYVLQDAYAVHERQRYSGGHSIGHEAHLAGSFVGFFAWFARRRYWI